MRSNEEGSRRRRLRLAGQAERRPRGQLRRRRNLCGGAAGGHSAGEALHALAARGGRGEGGDGAAGVGVQVGQELPMVGGR